MTLPINRHQNYHGHFYFEKPSSDYAAQVREQISERFGLSVGRFNQCLVGPHTKWSFSVDFSCDEFEALVSWLTEIRRGHSVLIHALSDDEYRDHTDHAYWLGEAVKLDLSIFTRA